MPQHKIETNSISSFEIWQFWGPKILHALVCVPQPFSPLLITCDDKLHQHLDDIDK